jgi:hypothetical protein
VFAGDIPGAVGALLTGLRDGNVQLGTILAGWGQQFLAWIGPLIPPLLAEANRLFLELVGWITANAPPLLERFLGEWLPAAIKWIAQAAIDAIPKLIEFMDAVKDWINGPGGQAIGMLFLKLGEAAIRGLAKGIWELNVWAYTELGKWLGELATQALAAAGKVGDAIVAGILAGIEAKWAELTAWLGARVQALISAARAALRISSPSQAFADQVGAPIVEGIAAGIRAAEPDALAALATVVARLTGAATAGVAGVQAILARPGAGGGGGGGGGSGEGSGGESGGPPDGGPMPGASWLADPLYRRIQANLGWHPNVAGRAPLDLGAIDYDPAQDTVRGRGTAGTNRYKSGYYRVWYRLNSLLNAGHATSVAAALAQAVEWVRANTPADAWGQLGWMVEGRAAGGPVAAGRTYLVGERGPELLQMGDQSGIVRPLGGDTIYITVNVPRWINDADRIADDIHAALLRKKQRGVVMGLA